MTMDDLHEVRAPENPDEADFVDKALAKELALLSVRERERILLDIHGVADSPTAPPECVSSSPAEQSLEQKLQHELDVLVASGKAAAYHRARQLDVTFVENPAFRQLFLRAEEWNAAKAAQRLAAHFQTKQELFVHTNQNDQVLVRNVTWNDLGADDRTVVQSGLFQPASQHDVAGRLVVFITPALLQASWKPENVARALWYFLMSALRTDVDFQTKGMVGVFLHVQAPSFPIHVMRKIVLVRSGLPILTGAVHQCIEDDSNPLVYCALVAFRFLLYASNNTGLSFRFRFHHGTLEQIALELQTFGIPISSMEECCPLSQLMQNRKNNPSTTKSNWTQGLSMEWHQSWLLAVRESEPPTTQEATVDQPPPAAEEGCKEGDRVIIPSRLDVIFGRGRRAREHPGCLRCHYLVRTHQEVYEKASRREKTKVADQVIALIHESGGRFLKQDERSKSAPDDNKCGTWVVVDNRMAREKVSHMFRRLREQDGLDAWQEKAMAKQMETVTTTLESTLDGVTFLTGKKSPHLVDEPAAAEPPRRRQRT